MYITRTARFLCAAAKLQHKLWVSDTTRERIKHADRVLCATHDYQLLESGNTTKYIAVKLQITLHITDSLCHVLW